MSTNCTNCSRHCNPATDCDTCPACRLLLDVARDANHRSRCLRVCAACCAGIAVLTGIAAVLVYLYC